MLGRRGSTGTGGECAHLQSHQDNEGKGKGPIGICEGAALFAGTHRESGDHVLCPDLVDFASREVEKDASIMKPIRKAREERHQAQTNKKEDT